MKTISWSVISILFLGFIFFFIMGCPGGKNIEIEKEKIKYQEKIDGTLDRADNLVAFLKTRGMEEAEGAEQLPDSIQIKVDQLEKIKNRLNQKSAQMDKVSDKNWSDLKSEIDQLIAEFEKTVKRNEME